MTRINVVPPVELSGKHLVAEYRELPRVFKLARPLRPSEKPRRYVLGPGHVRFFYDKLAYLTRRHHALVREMRARGYTVNFPDPPQGNPALYSDWKPDAEALAVNRARIKERS